MGNKDYEQKKKKCWEEYLAFNDEEYSKSAFSYAFDRAYALGKQTETITQEEIGKEAEHYDDKHTEQLIYDIQNDRTSWKPLQDGICNAFKAGANFALGKQEKDADTVIQGWVGRDQDGYISLFQERPTRDTFDKSDIPYGFWDEANGHHLELPITSFPDLTWDDDPEPVEIILKRKKNGNIQ